MEQCKICFQRTGVLVSICDCKGTGEFVHKECMSKWLAVSKSQRCPTCNFRFDMITTPFIFREFFEFCSFVSETLLPHF